MAFDTLENRLAAAIDKDLAGAAHPVQKRSAVYESPRPFTASQPPKQFFAGPATLSKPAVTVTIDRLTETLNFTVDVGRRVTAVADRLFGGKQTDEAKDPAGYSIAPNGVFGDVQHITNSIEAELRSIRDAVERMEADLG